MAEARGPSASPRCRLRSRILARGTRWSKRTREAMAAIEASLPAARARMEEPSRWKRTRTSRSPPSSAARAASSADASSFALGALLLDGSDSDGGFESLRGDDEATIETARPGREPGDQRVPREEGSVSSRARLWLLRLPHHPRPHPHGHGHALASLTPCSRKLGVARRPHAAHLGPTRWTRTFASGAAAMVRAAARALDVSRTRSPPEAFERALRRDEVGAPTATFRRCLRRRSWRTCARDRSSSTRRRCSRR